MIAGKGMRPGDILTAANGMTVEVSPTLPSPSFPDDTYLMLRIP